MTAPRLVRAAMPFTVIAEPGCVRLVGGEELRFTLRAPGIEAWLPPLVAALSAERPPPLAAALDALPAPARPAAERLVARLLAERALVEGDPRPRPAPHRLEIEGDGPVASALRGAPPPDAGAPLLRVLVQDTLDLAAALAFDRAARGGADAWLWITTGPAARALVSPVFLPDGGPCAGCLLAAFRRLSPAPELHDALRAHAARGGAFARTPPPPEAAAAIAALAGWKARALAEPDPPAALFALHVLELATFEVSLHPVPLDPDCEGAHAP